MTLSVGRKGQCWDNAVAESFFATVKTELIHRRPWPTRKAATSAIFDYIEGWYNTRRRHSTLGYLSPSAVRIHHHGHGRADSLTTSHRPFTVHGPAARTARSMPGQVRVKRVPSQ